MPDNDLITAYWNDFLKATNRSTDFQYFECFYFASTKEWANKLLQLVLDGRKKATSSSLYSYKNSVTPLPSVGNCSIVTDWDGFPHCVIETTNVLILPFKDITYDICKREGEDENLKSWQEGHIAFFTEVSKIDGFSFTWDMPVVFEDFKLIYTTNKKP